MDFNLVTNVENCYVDIPSLLYYSHIPTVAIALLIGLFVFIKNKKSLNSKILLWIAIFFFFWSSMDIILWLTHDSRESMFFWSIINLFETLVSIATLYFAYVFIEKRDVPLKLKIIAGILLSVFIVLIPTRFNLPVFKDDVCEGSQGPLIYYFYFLEALFSAWLLIYLISRIIKYWKTEDGKEIIYFSIGITAFLFSFSGANILGSALTALNINFLANSSENWKILQYGLFGMPIFMGFLAYLIVKYKAFSIKLLGTQALVTALVVLVGSELFFAESANSQILILITLAISLGFGYILIKSVKMEVERKEQLQEMSNKLAQANDKLRKLDNAKTEFISIASHQLRTPLTAIKGFLSLMLEGSYGKLNPKHEDVLNKVYTSNERLITLVEDLLNVSRIESGRMEFTFQKWDITKMCSELVDTFILKAKDRGLYIDYKKPKEALPEMETDGAKLREVISNLIDNAIKYTQKGGISIKIFQVNKNIQIIVSDTGIGIPQEELPYLFSKFSRGKDTNRLSVGGTGLGLYVGRSIMEALGGKIWAESEGAGKGSKFTVEVPIEHREEK